MNNVVLVSGAAGYIGSVTCRVLSAAGFIPVGIDNLSTGHKDFAKWGPLYIGDISDAKLVGEIIIKYKPVAVIHFAASAYVGESVNNPLKYFTNNIAESSYFFQTLIEHGIDKLVFSSTCATFGDAYSEPIQEDFPQNPINPYGYTKLALEKLLAYIDNSSGFKSISLRYFNAAGAAQDLSVGELHANETHLIPLCIEAGLTGKSLQIFGSDFPTKDGFGVRDYIHVEDLASAHLLALQALLNGGNSAQYNLGTGYGTSVMEVIQEMSLQGIDVPWQLTQARIGDPAQLVANPSKAIKELGWLPEKSDISTIIKDAISWNRKQPNNKTYG